MLDEILKYLCIATAAVIAAFIGFIGWAVYVMFWGNKGRFK